MGMCSSKDKKGTHPSPLITLDSYGKLAATRQSSRTAIAQSHDHNHVQKSPKSPSAKKPKSRRKNVKNKNLSNNNNAVEIWLPVVSPCRLKAFPVSYALSNSRDLKVDSSQSISEEEIDDDVEISSPTSNYYRSPCPPFLYSGYLSGASFSRDLAAALSRENHIGSFAPSPLSNWATSPARRVRRTRPGRNASMNAQYRGRSRRSHPGVVHSNMLLTENHSSSAPLSQSRLLPKQNTKNDNLDMLEHNDQSLNIHEERMTSEPTLKFMNTSHGKWKMDSLHTKELTGHSRGKCAMDSSDGKGIMHLSHGKGNIMGSSKKSRELPSQRKVVKANLCNEIQDQEQKNDVDDQPMHRPNTKARAALKDRPVNCPFRWDQYEAKENFKELSKLPEQKATIKTKPAADTYKDGCLTRKATSFQNRTNIVHVIDSSSSHNECLDKTPINVSACTDNAIDQILQPNGSMSNTVQSLISAIGKFNMEGRFLSEVDESEADSTIMQNDREVSNLLKAAARDAFCKPNRDHSAKVMRKEKHHRILDYMHPHISEMMTKDDHKDHDMFPADDHNMLRMTPELFNYVLRGVC